MPILRKRPRLTAVALAAVTALALQGCRRAEPPKPAPAPPPPKPAALPAPLPAPAPMDRAQLIAAAAKAAAAYAVGGAYPEDLGPLVGARFEARLPFGCAGEAKDAEVGYRVDAKRGTLTLQAQPEAWKDAPWARPILGAAPVEAVEGFWLRRPWIATDACPAIRAPGAAGPPSPESLGLAQLFTSGESRVLRHGSRGYQVVRKAEPGQLELQGFRLVLAGRIADFGDHQPIRCRSDSAEQRPVCLIAVELDRVTFEDPVSGQVLAEWRS
jgi:hypothetical protein